MSIRLSALMVTPAIGVACSPDGSQSSGRGQAATSAAAPAASTSPATPPAGESSVATGAPPPGCHDWPGERNAAAPAAAATPTPVESPKAQFPEITIPAGTAVSLTLATAVASNTAEVVRTVTEVNQSRVKGRASIACRFDRLSAQGETHDIRTARIARQVATRTEDAKRIGIGAGGVIGAIAREKKGAVYRRSTDAGAGAGCVGDTWRPGPAGSWRADQHALQTAVTMRIPVG